MMTMMIMMIVIIVIWHELSLKRPVSACIQIYANHCKIKKFFCLQMMNS